MGDTRRKKFETIAPGLEEFLAETDAKPVDENLVIEVLKYMESILNTLNEFQRSFELLESLTLYAHRHAVVPVRDQDVFSRLSNNGSAPQRRMLQFHLWSNCWKSSNWGIMN